MTMGDRIKTRQQLLDEQTKAAAARVAGDEPPDHEHPEESPHPIVGAQRGSLSHE